MLISRKSINVFTTSFLFSLSPAVFCQQIALSDPVNSKTVKATVIALSSAEFTRAPVTEEYLSKHGCRYETSAPEKIVELKDLINKTVRIDSSNTAAPTNLRTAIYLHSAHGTTYRYLFNAKGSSNDIYGTLQLEAKSTQIITSAALITGILRLAGPDTPSQKFSNTCF